MSEAVRFVQSKSKLRPKVAVVLGSGLGKFADTLLHATRIPYREIPGFPAATAAGHAGELVLGTLGANGSGTDVAVMSGRFHLYEGYTAHQVTCGIRLFKELGIRRVILTNAAGGIHPDFVPGALVLIADHINMQGQNPLAGNKDRGSNPRFPDMTEAYSVEMRRLAWEAADELEVSLQEGVYAAMLGPSYETPAEIRLLKTIGADLVGMSTVAEAIAANDLGMEVLGISCVTNVAAGLSKEKLNHADVLRIGQQTSIVFSKLLAGILPRLARE
jgi:purine-nucleoside phosphorylase